MMLKCRSSLCYRAKCVFSPPLLMGFIIGILSVYIYWLLYFDINRKSSIVTIAESNIVSSFNNHQRYYHVDLMKPSSKANITLLCLIFITDIDSLLMQHNIWLKKCGDNRVYVGKEKHKYIDHVITDTYSPHAWKYNCETLMYIHTKYNSGIVKYDWIFLAKDNVWLIYENLLHLISLLNVRKHKYNYYAGQYKNSILSMNAGILLSSNLLTDLVRLLDNVNACNKDVSYREDQMLDFYLKKLNNTIPIGNADPYGCTLFHSINLYGAFNANSLKPRVLNKCISDFAITFQFDLTTKYYAMFYKYVLYKVRLVTKEDLMPNANRILPLPSPEDNNIWRIEAIYELNQDPSNMSQFDFFYYWSKKRQIIL